MHVDRLCAKVQLEEHLRNVDTFGRARLGGAFVQVRIVMKLIFHWQSPITCKKHCRLLNARTHTAIRSRNHMLGHLASGSLCLGSVSAFAKYGI